MKRKDENEALRKFIGDMRDKMVLSEAKLVRQADDLMFDQLMDSNPKKRIHARMEFSYIQGMRQVIQELKEDLEKGLSTI